MGAPSLVLAVAAALLAGCSALVLTGGRRTAWRLSRVPGLARGALAALARTPLAERARRTAEAARRRGACLSELPVLLDVVTLGLSAGLSFDSSLELYCARYETELSRAFSEAMLEWRIGVASRDEALRRLADEVGVVALGRFASMVSEALAFGTPLASALERQAELLREEQRAQVEEEIERVPVKMLVPLGTLIVPAMFLAVLGPLLGSALVVT